MEGGTFSILTTALRNRREKPFHTRGNTSLYMKMHELAKHLPSAQDAPGRARGQALALKSAASWCNDAPNGHGRGWIYALTDELSHQFIFPREMTQIQLENA